jgi:cob(II)yrinic acid a,c-diamide reductase
VTALDSETFRHALQRCANTVHLVTYRTAEGDVEGMTATSVTSLSLTPPSLLVCINQNARAHDVILASGTFGVSVLAVGHETLADAAGRPGGNKAFGGTLTPTGTTGTVPGLADALATLTCKVIASHPHYTHTVFVADVVGVRLGAAGSPLIHYRGGYAQVR